MCTKCRGGAGGGVGRGQVGVRVAGGRPENREAATKNLGHHGGELGQVPVVQEIGAGFGMVLKVVGGVGR